MKNIMGASDRIIDAYAHDAHGLNAAKFDDSPPPVAPALVGSPSLLQLYVPSEDTQLDYGAGALPGIRMATDHHVHLTSRDTLTTISLGDPGGSGISKDDPPGISIFTAGAKRETVELGVEENYKYAKVEVVGASNTQNIFGTHTFGVVKNATYNYEANKTERIVGSASTEVMLNRNETIHGHSVVTMGSREEHVFGEKKWLNKGNVYNFTYGFSHDLFAGEKTSVNLGIMNTLNVGAISSANVVGVFSANLGYQRAFVAGSKQEVVAQTGIAINNGTKVTKDNMRVDSAQIIYKNSPSQLTKANLAVLVRQNEISSSALKIFK